MKKKILSVLLAGALLGSMSVAGMVAVSAEEETTVADSGLTPGSYSNHGTFTPKEGVKTKHLLFAMPGAWMNETWEKDPNGSAAGMYWWVGYQNCKDQGWPNDWPGYRADKVTEEGVDNMWEIDVPTYGNGEEGDATQIIWSNNIDGGTIKDDDVKNPFYKAAQQTKDSFCQYYSRNDKNDNYEDLFRYIYVNALDKAGLTGVKDVDLKSADFWETLNKMAAEKLGNKWDDLDAGEKKFQIDLILDEEELDFSEFGSYAGNFFNEDLVEEPEASNGDCIAFHFDNMVYVVDMDPEHITVSPLSGKPGFGGDWYFYYGAGEYGTWPTKELNKANGGVSGNVMSDEYRHGKMPDITIPETTGASNPSTAGTASTDATSSKSSSTTGSATNSSNGAIATGQTSLITIALIILVAGIGVVVFTRKRSKK